MNVESWGERIALSCLMNHRACCVFKNSMLCRLWFTEKFYIHIVSEMCYFILHPPSFVLGLCFSNYSMGHGPVSGRFLAGLHTFS